MRFTVSLHIMLTLSAVFAADFERGGNAAKLTGRVAPNPQRATCRVLPAICYELRTRKCLL